MDKLNLVREQKENLKKKILQLEGQNVSENRLSQSTIIALQQKKAKLQHERLQQEKYRKMQQQYAERNAQLEREKQLEKIRNQKRMIQLQVGMKRIVLNGVQQKVKGINSDQLLTRAMLHNGDDPSNNKLQGGRSKKQIKNEFEKYLLKQNMKKQKPKHDLYQLNEKRFQLFEKKQELLMRQILLKQIMNSRDPETMEDIDIMSCSKEELQKLLEDMQIDIEDYKHPINSKLVMENYPQIEESIKSNIINKKQQIQKEQQRSHKLRAEKASLRDWVRNHPEQSAIKQVNQILDSVLLNLVYDYEKRHFPLSKDEKDQKLDQLQKQYETILFDNEFYQLAVQIVDNIEQKVNQEILYETAQEIHQLHEFTHQTTALSFDWMFSKSNYLDIIKMEDKRLDKIELNFKNEAENIRYDKNDRKNVDKVQNKNSQQNVFETQKLTSQLINDIKLLTSEEQFFSEVSIEIKRQVVDSIDQNDFKVNNQNGLYVITPKGIKLISEQKDVSRNVFTFPKQLKNIRNVKKLNNLWIVQTNDTIYVHSQWNLQCLPVAIGQRINSPCGTFTNVEIYPTFTLLGSLCSILIGFQKGQLMKYNFNRNRINSTQTNITHYVPLGPNIKTGDQAAFPLNNRNAIQFITEKPKQGDIIHEFRQFFDFHTTQIISVSYYKDNMFLTVDKSLNCAIWLYDERRGIKSYEPLYTFKIKSQYKTYKESQNARFKDLYPSPSIPQSGQELYKKWMENQTYLKLQIYNNPKKNSAYFKSPKWDDEKDQQPIWKLNYDEKSRKIIKIFQTYYHLTDGKSQCRQVKLWKEYVILLVEKQHVMRGDLKTVKIYTWSIEDKKLRTVAIEFDTFQEQKTFSFEILQNKIQTNEFPLIATISSGKILIFSMLSGQLLKDISEEKTCSKIKNYNFTWIEKGFFDNFYGITRRSIVELIIQNKNSKQKKGEFSKIIEITRKKYNNLI